MKDIPWYVKLFFYPCMLLVVFPGAAFMLVGLFRGGVPDHPSIGDRLVVSGCALCLGMAMLFIASFAKGKRQ